MGYFETTLDHLWQRWDSIVREEEGLRLFHVEIDKHSNKYVVRVYIEGEESITVDDCELITRKLLKDLSHYPGVLPFDCLLEVSSPGEMHVLTLKKSFDRVKGEKLQLRLGFRRGTRHEVRHCSGKLVDVDEEGITLFSHAKNTVVFLRWKTIEFARVLSGQRNVCSGGSG